MRKVLVFGTGVLMAVGVLATPAGAEPRNWGQEVKQCNLTSCYPGGTSRGAFVRGQASDGQGPGYAWEIHTLASPGNSAPTPFG
jgi:hypothetical protein